MLQIAKNYFYLQIIAALGWSIFFLCIDDLWKRKLKHMPFIALSVLNTALFFSPIFIIVHIVVFALPIIVARSRSDLGIVMVAGLFGVPAFQVELAIGSVDLFAWTLQATLALGGACALLKLPANGRVGRLSVNSPLALFMLLCIVIAGRGTAATNWLRQSAAIAFGYGLPVFVISACARNSEERRSLMAAIAAMGAIVAAILIYEARAHWPLYASLYARYHVVLSGLVVKLRNGAMRAYGPLDDATGAGFAVVITLLAALGSESIFKRGATRYGVPLLILIGLLAPQSRGSLIGAGIGILAFSWYRYGSRGFGKALGSLALVGTALAARSQWAAGHVGDADDTGEYRKRLFMRGMEEFQNHPLFGGEFRKVLIDLADMRQGEGIVDIVNSYLYYALFTGAVGLTIFCFVLFYPIGRLVAVRAVLKRDLRAMSFAGFTFAALLAGSVMLAFTSIPQRSMIMLLALAGAALSQKRSEERVVHAPIRAMAADGVVQPVVNVEMT